MKTKRIFIGVFGRRNQGKSSLVNAIAKQDIAIVSDIAGTTTDPVRKTIEILGLGPAVLVDTAGIDDEGEIGQKRVRKTLDAMNTIDVAVLVISGNRFGDPENTVIRRLGELEIPYLIVHNKSDEAPLREGLRQSLLALGVPVLECSAAQKAGIDELVNTLIRITPESAHRPDSLVGGLVREGDLVVLVMPQDNEAPEGRLILPQVQVIRDLLDNHAVAIALQPEELRGFLQKQPPALVITDSQAFAQVSAIIGEVAPSVPLTSFSIILSRSKGNFGLCLQGTRTIAGLHDGDRILMMESCTHTATCDDIGRHKLPNLLRKVTGKELHFDFVAALDPLPEDLAGYALAIQCGGCMVTKRQLQNRVRQVVKAGVPISNYGMSIAWLTGIFERVTEMFSADEE